MSSKFHRSSDISSNKAAGVRDSRDVDSGKSEQLMHQSTSVNKNGGKEMNGTYFLDKLLLNENYENLEVLGSGGFGIVLSANFVATQEKVAVKTIFRQKDTIIGANTCKDFLLEIDFVASFKHPNIVRLIQADKENLCFSLEFAKGGDLRKLVTRQIGLKEETARHIFQGVLNAISYLHDELVIHNDIKPENILLMDDSYLPVVKLTDFGCSIRFNDPTKKVSGTLRYCAPEKLENAFRPLNERQLLTEKLDIYSIGLSLYVSCTNESPFKSKYAKGIIEEIRKDCFTWNLIPKLNIQFSQGCIFFMMECLNYDATARPSAKKLKCHAWFKQKDVTNGDD